MLGLAHHLTDPDTPFDADATSAAADRSRGLYTPARPHVGATALQRGPLEGVPAPTC